MAYSSIAHGGYLLIGLAAAAAAVASPDVIYRGGVMAMLFYLIVYILATMGTFAALAFLGSAGAEVNDVDELAGLAKSRPVVSGAIAIFMFSLAGLPPLAGFWGKLNLFASAVELATSAPTGLANWFTFLAIAGALNAAIAAAYYLRIIAVMYFQPSVRPVAAAGGPSAWLAAVACAALVIGMGALPGRILEMAAQSEAAFRPQVQTVKTPAGVEAALVSSSTAASIK
jgi:NADH-quinone oxidoreductase subunit N